MGNVSGRDRKLFQFGSLAPGFTPAATIGADQSFTKQDGGHRMAVGRGDVGEYAAIIFCAGYVGYGDRTVIDEQKERLARLLRRASLGVAARFHLRRVYAADTHVHPHGMAGPDDSFG